MNHPLYGGNTSEPLLASPKKQKRNSVSVRSQPSADSSRSIDADLPYFLGDNIKRSGILGIPIENYGKAAVMTAANRGLLPKFNKYSGVCEWRNSVFLWVNIGGGDSGNQYVNEFSEGGRRMTWFGGSKMTGGNCRYSVTAF